MLRCARRRGFSSATNVALGCTAIAIVVSIVTLSGDFSSQHAGSSTDVVRRAANRLQSPEYLSPTELYELVAPSVVTVIVKDEDGEQIGTGSGFFIEEVLLSKRHEGLVNEKTSATFLTAFGIPTQYGYVLTNYHVIRPAVDADVILFNGEAGTVETVIAEDETLDLALLAVNISSKQPLTGIPFALDDPRILTTVYAIGSPHGLQGSASEGRLSARREFGDGHSWLQTTAPISPGSSGGPLLSADGRLVGVTTSGIPDAQNLNFAIPVSVVRSFLASTPFEPRAVAEGASIQWEEEGAIHELKTAALSGKYNDAQRSALELLVRATGDPMLGIGVQERIAHDSEASTWAQEASQSVPEEFKYLGHYIAGKSSLVAAWSTAWASGNASTTPFEALYRSTKHAKVAHQQLLEAIRGKPDFAPAYERLALHLGLSGNWADQLLVTDRLIMLMPRCAEALQERALCYSQLNQPESAKNDLRAAIELSPRDAKLHLTLANTLRDLGEYADAIKSYETTLELGENSDDGSIKTIRSAAQHGLGLAHIDAGNFEKAISSFMKLKAMGWPAVYCDEQIARCRRGDR
jgi:S1-C subfamily serine protease/tetratricopeptide (TPR) repeat protein